MEDCLKDHESFAVDLELRVLNSISHCHWLVICRHRRWMCHSINNRAYETVHQFIYLIIRWYCCLILIQLCAGFHFIFGESKLEIVFLIISCRFKLNDIYYMQNGLQHAAICDPLISTWYARYLEWKISLPFLFLSFVAVGRWLQPVCTFHLILIIDLNLQLSQVLGF